MGSIADEDLVFELGFHSDPRCREREVCRTGPLGRRVPRAEIGGVQASKPVCALENRFGGLALLVIILSWFGVVRDTRVAVRELSASIWLPKVQL